MNNNNSVNGFVAILLTVLMPGLGHLYLRRNLAFVLYLIGFFAPALGAVFFAILFGSAGPFILIIGSVVVWFICFIDMCITLANRKHNEPYTQATESKRLLEDEHQLQDHHNGGDNTSNVQNQVPYDRFQTILLSLMPGLGHFHLGLMHRGLTFLVGFFGIISMIIFVSFMTSNIGFLVFFLILPIIWLYSIFDAIRLSDRKIKGETLTDQSILEDFQENQEQGKKNKVLATLLSIFPGAGHLYLGLQRRGIQLMAAFLFSIYIIDTLRLSIFLFLIPIIWFYSFFDALQHASKSTGDVKDVPIVSWLINHQKWVGFGLLALGLFYLIDRLALPIIDEMYPTVSLRYYMSAYFQMLVVSLLLIGGGLKLLFSGMKGSQEEVKQ